MDTHPSNAQPETSPSRSPDASDTPTAEKVTSSPDSAPKPNRKRRLRIWVAAIAAVLLVGFGVPWIQHSFNTVSTDDAYVNSYVTFVAPRVRGQVSRVLVDDNNRVKKGDVLVELDPKPYQVQVAIKQAAVDTAKANLVVAQATVRGLIGQTRSIRFKLARAIEDVDNQVALIRARVATWEQDKATQVLAQPEFDRAERLLATKVSSPRNMTKARSTRRRQRAGDAGAGKCLSGARGSWPARPTSRRNELDRCSSGSRSDLFLGSPGAGRTDAKRRPARRCPIVLQSHAQADGGGILPARSERRHRSNLCRDHQERAGSKTSRSERGAGPTRSRSGRSSICAIARSSRRSTASSRAAT